MTMGTHDGPVISRRRFVQTAGLGVASVAGLAAACTGSGGTLAGTGGGNSAGRGFIDTVLAAFKTHRLVGLGEAHGLQDHHDALTTLLTDPRLPELVNDIVVEFGNALYQRTIDRFIGGQPVANAELRPAWRNTTQSPEGTWDQPVYEQFYRTVRAVNWTLSPSRRLRVLLGDPPIDWSKITTQDDLQRFERERDTHAASVVQREVLDRGHRALLCYGGEHLMHWPRNSTLVSILEQRTGERTYTIVDLFFAVGDPGGLARRLSPYPRNTVIPTAGTWLGSFNAGLVNPTTSGKVTSGRPHHHKQQRGTLIQHSPTESTNPWCGVPLGRLIDGGLYMGQPDVLTASRWNPAIYLDPTYWKELQRRNAIMGGLMDLDSYRQEQPAQFPLIHAPLSTECRKALT
jgi:hypothetical protein